MAILIKNPEVERKARELAGLRGQTITAAIASALDDALANEKPRRRKLSLEEMIAATDRMHERAGITAPLPPMTKADWDELNEIPGLPEDRD